MKPILLIILDGFGMRDEIHGNAIKQAKKPNFDYLWHTYPHSLLDASGEYVGLPNTQMGNSEVGHLNIGAGRVVLQPLQIINNSIINNELKHNAKLLKVIEHVKKNESKLHIMGLCSDGGVHSHINHILSLIEIAKYHQINKLYIHVFLDGRDTLPSIGLKFIEMIENKIKEVGIGSIATISGRYYAMDRDNNWDRTKKAYDAIVNGLGKVEINGEEIIKNNYKEKIYDEFVIPTVIDKDGIVDSNDGILCTNFRTDRIVQLLRAITEKNFNQFEIKEIKNIEVLLLMPAAKLPKIEAIFEPIAITNTLGEYLSKLGYKQLRIAETEKYAHVTYFFDGLKDLNLTGCDKILIPSPKVKTYDLKPEMSVYEITDKLLAILDENKYDVIVLNYANPDMVGHTTNLKATIVGIEAVDKCLGQLYQAIKKLNGLLIVTGDHGNAEYLIDSNNNEITAHTMSKVPFIVCHKDYIVKDGKLGDIAPTILSLLNEKIPIEMTGNIIVSKKI